MFKVIGSIVVVLVAGVLVAAAFQPDRFQVKRSSIIDAPPERIYALISDFHRWRSWSPYEQLDPGMRRTYSGAERGAGSVYEWAGNSKAGQGRMEITRAPQPSEVAIKLDFIEPIEAHNVATFTLEPRGGATTVTWVMDGATPYVGKIIHLFLDMDRLVGKDFETGLANLKAVAEH
jgi:uncharacterized protein YndB with AHSA1/START domain